MSSLSQTSTLLPTRRLLGPLVVGSLFAGALVMLSRTFASRNGTQFMNDLPSLEPVTVLAALAATLISYLAMTAYDGLALRHVGYRLPYRRYGLASFIATAFGNSLGASAVVGAGLRARIYSSWHVPAFAITQIIGFNVVTVILGAAVLAGIGMLHDPTTAGQALHLPPAIILTIAAMLLAAVVGYLLWAFAGHPIRWRTWSITQPTPGSAMAQVVLSTFEWLTMAAALYVLLPAHDRISFLSFAVSFTIATVAGLVSNVPGGLGVFETALVVLIGSTTSPSALAVALLTYRLCYFALPLVMAGVLLVVHEARPRTQVPGAAHLASARVENESARPSTAPVPTSVRLTSSPLVPSALATTVAGVGAFMLIAGDLPGPLGLALSEVTISFAGLAALLMAWGLHQRLRRAWVATMALLSGITVLTAVHGDLGLAAVGAGLAVLLAPTRSGFYRGAKMVWPPKPVWLVAATALVGVGVWWFELSGLSGAFEAPLLPSSISADATGADRLALLACTVGILIGGLRALRVASPTPLVGSGDQLAQVEAIVATSGRCLSQLAFTGDKRFHFSSRGTAFLMYQVQGRSWVVMGDPVGDPADFPELVRSFLTHIDQHGGRPAFYNVLTDHIDLYRDCGLSLAKLGEEAVVPLADFTLTGKARMGLRNCRNKSMRLGMTVDFVAAHDVAPLLPALRAVSDVWLTHRNGKEKRFSLGAFDEEYVTRFPLVLVRQADQIIVFATLWVSADGQEVQVDLMRRLPDGPRTVMTYLFVECILWAKENGCTSFNLGMAPLSGLRTDATAPFWDRIGHLLWTHGEKFYNFKGLRTFKQGFNPSWRTCYVAAPGGMALPNAMVNVATLVGGGFRGVLRG